MEKHVRRSIAGPQDLNDTTTSVDTVGSDNEASPYEDSENESDDSEEKLHIVI